MSLYTRGFAIGLTAAVALSGCSFDLDPSVLKDDDSGSEDHGFSGGARDASVWMQPDASVLTAQDAFVLPNPCDFLGASLCVPDASTPDAEIAKPSCTNDEECSADEICSVSKVCIARCTEDMGCFAQPVNTQHLRSDGARALYLRGATNAVGEVTPPYVLYAWNLGASEIELGELPSAHTAPTLEFVAGGYAFGLSREVLWRYPLDGSGSAVTIDAQVTRAWTKGESIFWSKKASGAHELWRARVDGAMPSSLVMIADHPWLGGNTEVAVHLDDPGAASDGAIYSLQNHTKTPIPWRDCFNDVAAVDDDSLYCPIYGSSTLNRVASSGQGPIVDLGPRWPGSPPMVTPFDVTSESWVYWVGPQVEGSRKRVVYGRTHKSLASAPEEIAEVVFPAAGPGVSWSKSGAAIVGDQLVFIHLTEKRFVTKSLPPFPCGAKLPCGNGTTCGADNHCH